MRMVLVLISHMKQNVKTAALAVSAVADCGSTGSVWEVVVEVGKR